MTNRETVSRVRTIHKLLGDSRITDRAILAEVKGNALILMKQKADQRKLWNSPSAFTPIPCIEMETVPLGECCGISSTQLVSRSKLELPTIAESNYPLIMGVYDIGFSQDLKYAPLNRYINLQKLGLCGRDVYYFIHDNRLIVTKPNVALAKIIAIFDTDPSDYLLHPECGCNPNKKPCESKLDREFKVPGYLISTAIEMASNKLLGTYFKIPMDHTSDNKDDTVNRA